mmetsp:Transcript_7435/g.12576  ORF Transcript_7435/g.12576 Transcript_7435/m.12576 type:complete len:1066 (+) Transcript_7435:114-3311(+)
MSSTLLAADARWQRPTSVTTGVESSLIRPGETSEPLDHFTIAWRMQLDAALRASEAAEQDNRTALADADHTLTMQELQHNASWVARLIWQVCPSGGGQFATGGEPSYGSAIIVAMFVDKSAVCVISALGALLAGAKFVDVPATSKAAEIVRILNVVQPNILLTSSSLRTRLPTNITGIQDANILLIDGMPLLAGPSPSLLKPIAFLPDCETAEGATEFHAASGDGAFCVLTSGTTALAKIVVCPHAALTNATVYFKDDDLDEHDRVGLFWVYYYMFSVIGAGAALFVLPDSVFFNPDALVECVREQQLTGLYVTPSIITSCLEGLEEAKLISHLASLRVLWFTGEKLTIKMRAKLRRLLPKCRVRNVYSTNESGDNGLTDDDSAFTIFDEVQFQIREPQSGELAPVGAAGALHVRSPWLFHGYWTSDGIQYTTGSDEWFRTGDIVRSVGTRKIEFVSREASSHIKVRGFKIFPELIEAELTKHPDIEAAWCAAVGEDTEDDTTNRLEAAVSLPETSTLGTSALRTFMVERVPSYMVPVSFRRMGSGPISPAAAGKRPGPKELAELIPHLPDLGDEGRPTLSDHEAHLAAVWSSVLRLPISTFDARSNFFDYGGSLSFMTLAKVISEKLGMSIPVTDLLQVPTLAAMSGRLYAPDSPSLDDTTEFDAIIESAKYPIVHHLKAAAPLDTTAAAVVSEANLVRYRAIPHKALLVTGCTGYLGAFLMRTFARRPDISSVFCLVRAHDIASAGKRLRATCARRGIDTSDDFDEWFRKVVPIAGDVGQARFGLNDTDYAKLACTTHSVVHAAAEVNMLKPPIALSPTNVGGTSNVLSFAVLASIPVIFTSTICPLDGAMPTGYRQSKEAAEALFASAYTTYGVPSAVLQLGDIGIGMSESPLALPDDDYVVLLLRTCIALRKFPLAPWAVSIISVDQCCDTIAQLTVRAQNNEFASRAKEMKGDLVQWETIYKWLSPKLPMLHTCTLAEWQETVAHVAEHGEQDEYPSSAVTAAKRVQLLLPSINSEFSAEELRRLAGDGADGSLTIDEAWGSCFGRALSAEHAQRQLATG